MLNYEVINPSDIYCGKVGCLINCSQIEATLLFKDINSFKTYKWEDIKGCKICI